MADQPSQNTATQATATESSAVVERGRILAQWDFPEYEKPERGMLWYTVAFGLGGGLLIWAVLDANFLFALIILLFAFIIFTHHRRDPQVLTFTLYERGMQIGDRFYLFREVQSFALIYEPPLVKRLYIMPRNALVRREISIPLGDQDPVRLRAMLLDFLVEDLERESESGTDVLNRVLKL
jgi:hypothetical protein